MRIEHRTVKNDKALLRRRERGFSMIEIMIVCVVLAIISVIAIPNIVQVNNNYKLDAAGHSVASLLQQARMQAVRTNVPTYTKYDTSSGLSFVTNDPSNSFTSTSPDVALAKGLSFQSAPTVNHDQLDAYVGASSTNTPQYGAVGFNARGLPCLESGGNNLICQSPTAGFEWFIQNQSGGWEAVTVLVSVVCWW